MNKAENGKANDEYVVKRLSAEDDTKRVKSDVLSGEEKEKTAGKPQKVSVCWRVTAVSHTPDEILEKVFREGKNKKNMI